MRLGDLFETEESDRTDRLRAVLAHGQIKYWLEHNADRLDSRLTSIPTGPFAGGFLMRSDLCDLDEDYPDLVVIFAPSTKTVVHGNYVSNGGFFRKAGKSFIVIPCLLAPNDTKYLSTRFGSGGRTSFIHEFMHYLMSKKKPKNIAGSAHHMETGDAASYFNDPDETNAYYQEGAQNMAEFIAAVARNAPEATKDWLSWSTSDFVAYMKKTFMDKDFIAHVNPKVSRALDKRIARFIETTIRPIILRANQQNT